MNKKIMIGSIIFGVLLLLVIVLIVVLPINDKSYDDYISTDISEDETGGSYVIPDGFSFKFTNHDEFVDDVSPEFRKVVETCTYESLVRKQYTYIGVVSEYSIEMSDGEQSYIFEYNGEYVSIYAVE